MLSQQTKRSFQPCLFYCRRRSLLSASYKTTTGAKSGSSQQPLIELDRALLCYPESSSVQGPYNLRILPPAHGGHALLGPNGIGKTLVCNALVNAASGDHVRGGSIVTEPSWNSRSVAHVSFQSHQNLLRQGGTVSKAISGGGSLTKAAQFLVVRFGLYHLLYRNVATLSERPRLLVLDNAFDGLDVSSREQLKGLVSKTIQGFRPDILVQAVSAKSTAHTQVLLSCNRAEEIVDKMTAISFWKKGNGLTTIDRGGMSGADLVQLALGLNDHSCKHKPSAGLWDLELTSLPSVEEIRNVWKTTAIEGPIIRFNKLTLQKGDAVLLNRLDL
jgi:hypothetical protein